MSQQEKSDILKNAASAHPYTEDWQSIVHKYLQHWKDLVPDSFASELQVANRDEYTLLEQLYRYGILTFPSELPDAFKKAALAVYYAEDWQPIIHSFLLRWHDLTPGALTHVLQAPYEDSKDKLLVLYALGFLTYPEASSLLRPFIHSTKPAERWISILSLGRHRELTAFPLLQSLLLENLCDLKAPHYEPYLDFDWYMSFRYEIAFELGEWGNPMASATLCEAIRQCRVLQLHPDQYIGETFSIADKPPYELNVYDHWGTIYERFIDALTFALGKLGARDALMTLALPPAHWRYAQLYFLFGALCHAEPYPIPTFTEPPVSRRLDGTLQVAYSTIARILQALEAHFQASKEEQEAFLSQILLATEQRAFERYPRNVPGYEEHFSLGDSLDDQPF